MIRRGHSRLTHTLEVMKLERSPSDPYLLFGVLVLIVASIFGVGLVAQHQAELDNLKTIQVTIHRAARQ